MFKVMITAASSNSGKTAVTCGLLALLKRRGMDPCAFKCGPDYIDPMFHRSVLGIDSSNLDVFLAGEEGVRSAFARGCAGHDAAVIEGVMGYYDGMTVRRTAKSGTSAPAGAATTESECAPTRPEHVLAAPSGSGAASESSAPGACSPATASAWHVASLLEVPAVLVLRPKGAALTLAAVIKGMAQFRQPSRICGVVFNDCSEMYYRTYGPLIEAESGIPVLGYLPHMEEAGFESRHLGLMTAGEIQDLGARIDRIGARMEETIDLDRLFEVCGDFASGSAAAASSNTVTGGATAPNADAASSSSASSGSAASLDNAASSDNTAPSSSAATSDTAAPSVGVRIAVAQDAAFNFTYAESIRALEEAGAEICCFSPLKDRRLPAGISGLYLPGGYPELYAKQLAENESMRESIRAAILGGLPTIAECGGFLYLSQRLEDPDGTSWPMAGALPGEGAGTGKLVRFGYGTVGCKHPSMLFQPGEEIPVHEFHYWDTTQPGNDLTLTKSSNGRQWAFGYATETLYAGFPHLYLAGSATATGRSGSEDGSPKRCDTLAHRFVRAARAHRRHKDTRPGAGDPADGVDKDTDGRCASDEVRKTGGRSQAEAQADAEE